MEVQRRIPLSSTQMRAEAPASPRWIPLPFGDFEMALSLPGERSLAAATPANPVLALFAFIAARLARRRQRKALESLLDLDATRLRDLGVTGSDIFEAIRAEQGRSAAMVLNAARAKAARG
jgi:uncharacterized protein YjiS (DUF1127 family)